MSDEILLHSGALKIQDHCIVDDIDEDDRDALRVVIEVTNEGDMVWENTHSGEADNYWIARANKYSIDYLQKELPTLLTYV